MKFKNLFLLAALTVFTQRGTVFADQPFRMIWHGTGGWGDKSAYCKLYDPKNVETIRGVIVTVESVIPQTGMREGVQLEVRTEKETIPVQLGPKWYLENQDIDLGPNDNVQITGSRIACEGRRVMAAAEVRKGNDVLKLRDAQGRPLWAVVVK